MFLIDGYNLLHSLARERSGVAAREHLISLLEAFCAGGAYRARLVFDPTSGMKRNERRGTLEIRNVPQGRTADEEILEALRATDDRTEFTVVSNDREIVRTAQKRRCAVLPCEEFARMISKRPGTPEKGGPVSPGEVDYWMREFGLDDPDRPR